MATLAHLHVIQHTSAEYLGLLEDHLEGRRIRFSYHRPFTESGHVPRPSLVTDGLIVLGGGPWGSAGPRNLPSLVEEVELVHDCLARDVPVLGFGLGAQILALAAGGRTHPAPLSFDLTTVISVSDDALHGYLPREFPLVRYGRDRYELPARAQVLARDDAGETRVFAIGDRAFGFDGHPGFKPAIGEDLVMEFEEGPPEPAATLVATRAAADAIADALVPIMTGLVLATGWMETTAPAGE